MSHGRLRISMALTLALSVSLAHADHWQPIRPVDKPSAAAAPERPEARPSIAQPRLGKPVPASAEKESATVRTSYTPKLGSPSSVIRAQGPGLPPVAAPPPGGVDERYACGEVIPGRPGATWTGPSTSRDVFSSWGLSICSDHRFDDMGFISPSSNPFFFEDPRALTEIRPLLLYEKSPGGNALNNGGNNFFFGAQGRLAFNEWFSIVVNKLGGIETNSDGGIMTSTTTFAELWLGPKFTFLANECSGSIAAFGLTFEIPIGGGSAFQDTGNGAVTPYISYAQQLWTNFHFIGTAGYRISFNDQRSDSFFLSAHLDYSFYNIFFPFVELNWFHYTSNGTTTVANNEGRDLINFGSTNVSGHDIVTMAIGMRWKITPCIEAGGYYEFPISNREDLLSYRIGLDVIFRY